MALCQEYRGTGHISHHSLKDEFDRRFASTGTMMMMLNYVSPISDWTISLGLDNADGGGHSHRNTSSNEPSRILYSVSDGGKINSVPIERTESIYRGQRHSFERREWQRRCRLHRAVLGRTGPVERKAWSVAKGLQCSSLLTLVRQHEGGDMLVCPGVTNRTFISS
jgi:hypothetical protein